MTHAEILMTLLPAYLMSAVPGLVLFARSPRHRRLEFLLSVMCLAMSGRIIFFYFLETTVSEAHIPILIRWSMECVIICAFCFLNFIAHPLKLKDKRLLWAMDGIFIVSFVLNPWTSIVLSHRLLKVTSVDGRLLATMLKPSLTGQVLMVTTLAALIYFFYRLGIEIFKEGRRTLLPLFAGCAAFMSLMAFDFLIGIGWVRSYQSMPFGFLILLACMIYYLTDQMDRGKKQLEDQKARLETLTHAQNEFFSVAGHELQTPITSLVGYVEMLCDGRLGTLPDSAQAPLNRISLSIRRLQRLVSSILDVSRLQKQTMEFHPKPIRIDLIAQEVVEESLSFWSAANLDVHLDIAKETSAVHADPYRAHQALFNVLAFSSKNTPPGGRMQITISSRPGGVTVEVNDTSPGVDEADMRHVFDPFFNVGGSEYYTSHPDDSCGLGLYIAKQLMELQGGKITLRSIKNEGNRFVLFFPYQPLTGGAPS